MVLVSLDTIKREKTHPGRISEFTPKNSVLLHFEFFVFFLFRVLSEPF